MIAEIKKILPREVLENEFTYIEPFVGGGAILFWMLNSFPKMKKAIINDINSDLINSYKIIASKPRELISILKVFQTDYHYLQDKESERKEYYYQKRDLYNSRNSDKITQAALFIFLNRTCFNGLYRVNRSNLFNVPMGSYKLPMICDEQNILAVSGALQSVEIINFDFEKTLSYAGENTFFYLDPPYKPLSATSSFNSYAEVEFNDREQIRLRDFCKKLDKLKSKWILSNSDVQQDDFLVGLYEEFFVDRVKAKRVINSKSDGRGELNELLITNYALTNYQNQRKILPLSV